MRTKWPEWHASKTNQTKPKNGEINEVAKIKQKKNKRKHLV